MSQAGKTSDTGLRPRTGKLHPQVENIAHLSSPVPSNSNVKQDADQPHLCHESDGKSLVAHGSQLQDSGEENAGKAEEEHGEHKQSWPGKGEGNIT